MPRKIIKRPRRIFRGKKHRYIRIKGQKEYFDNSKSDKQLLKIVINNHLSKSKRRPRKEKSRIETLHGGLPGNLAGIVLGDVNTKYAKLSEDMQQKQLQYLTKIQQLEGTQRQLETANTNLQDQILNLPAPVQPQLPAPPVQPQLPAPRPLPQIPGGTPTQTPAKKKTQKQPGIKITQTFADGKKEKTFIDAADTNRPVGEIIKEHQDRATQLEQHKQDSRAKSFQIKLNSLNSANKDLLQNIAGKLGVDTQRADKRSHVDRKETAARLIRDSPRFQAFVHDLSEKETVESLNQKLERFYDAQPAPPSTPRTPQSGTGNGDENGLYGSQIMEIMDKLGINKKKGFMGVFAANQIPNITAQVNSGMHRVSFIMNLDPSSKPGIHWVAVYIDTKHDRSLEYYDSFGRDPSESFMRDILGLINALEPGTYLKFKVNRIIEQRANSTNCGYFACKFLVDRYDGVPFKECTGYSQVIKNEKSIREFKTEIKKFNII